MALQARKQLWDQGHDEKVEVNQRALIDKVLARYSGEFTVFREFYKTRMTLSPMKDNVQEEDWNRLKKIAEGNPDEEKIGAFGTEEPFVTSGAEWMGFHWRENQYVRYSSSDTPIPVAFDFVRFLASSITFMNYLSTVSTAKLTKSAGIPKELGLPRTLNVSNKSKMMTLNKLNPLWVCPSLGSVVVDSVPC
ncbi:hypothetical protein DFJ43DRAFT_1146230 [Lentinula guzmanii]|uniref:Uncharacterized protein n=1 Tax=Lentinula guzmanii TaxID=2804957 RepID=A0AA38JHQ8_9AGAR|nr:hypothetical protein DFJ43DRAFT_1146230 [Lentinula guzmanii]